MSLLTMFNINNLDGCLVIPIRKTLGERYCVVLLVGNHQRYIIGLSTLCKCNQDE